MNESIKLKFFNCHPLLDGSEEQGPLAYRKLCVEERFARESFRTNKEQQNRGKQST